MRVGTIVRVPLHGRRVRGWIVADDVEPDAAVGRVLPISKVVGAGPPADVLDLCRWTAHRWAGRRRRVVSGRVAAERRARTVARVATAVFPRATDGPKSWPGLPLPIGVT